jgi:hypothetical protein
MKGAIIIGLCMLILLIGCNDTDRLFDDSECWKIISDKDIVLVCSDELTKFECENNICKDTKVYNIIETTLN